MLARKEIRVVIFGYVKSRFEARTLDSRIFVLAFTYIFLRIHFNTKSVRKKTSKSLLFDDNPFSILK